MKGMKILAVVALLALAVGFTHGDNYQEELYTVRLHHGQTVEGVSEAFYDKNEDGACYDMFRYRVLERNKALFSDGRVPQVNDLVVVPVMVKK